MPTGPTPLPGPRRKKPGRRRELTTEQRGYGTVHRKARAALLARHPVCQRCEDKFSEHMHHRDRNTFNRAASNLEALCADCHRAEHAGG